MRIVFLGTAEFAVPSLRACSRHADVVAVITQPDRPGRRGRPAPRPVADAALELGLDVRRPARLRAPAAVEEVLGLGADALVVAAYGQILPAQLLDAVPHGGINVHASLLPRWRGAAPVAAAILAGDEVTGVSIMSMDAGVDTGPVHVRRPLPVGPRATTPELTAQLAEAGAALLVEVLGEVEAGTARPVPQHDALATLAPRLSRADSALDWRRCSAIEVDRRVRALNPWPGVVASLAGVDVQLLAGSVVAAGEEEPRMAPPGSVTGIGGEAATVVTAQGAYRVELLRPPGRRAMSGAAFLRGRRSSGAAAC